MDGPLDGSVWLPIASGADLSVGHVPLVTVWQQVPQQESWRLVSDVEVGIDRQGTERIRLTGAGAFHPAAMRDERHLKSDGQVCAYRRDELVIGRTGGHASRVIGRVRRERSRLALVGDGAIVSDDRDVDQAGVIIGLGEADGMRILGQVIDNIERRAKLAT